MPSSHISSKLENHIEEYAREAAHEIENVMQKIAEDATKVAKATLGTTGGGDDSIHRGIHPVSPKHFGGLWEAGVGAHDWKSNFFEKGTHAHKITSKSRGVYSYTKTGRRRRRRLRTETEFVSGVKGYGYLRKGIYVASASLRQLVASRFARIRV